jgi:hypothetical protein
MVQDNREADRQDLGFCARPFDLCRLPVRRPPSGCLLHERRNGQFVLQVTGHGLPRGQDRLVPIFFATTRNRLATGPGGGHPPRPIQLHVGGRTWYSRDPDQRLLPGDCHKMIVLSDEFYRAILSHPITDLEAAKVLSASPVALDLFAGLSYPCLPRVGGSEFHCSENWAGVLTWQADYARPRKFREKLEGCLKLIRPMWPECPAHIDPLVARAQPF